MSNAIGDLVGVSSLGERANVGRWQHRAPLGGSSAEAAPVPCEARGHGSRAWVAAVPPPTVSPGCLCPDFHPRDTRPRGLLVRRGLA